ncbi:MAG TPA: sigma-70 family RNA polymerase sigma factor [Solirubrobacteraceae bacterium]|nr:sigma-70 family RNA polymerase sigma factor [Solirubrobacteraceae bacterium]
MKLVSPSRTPARHPAGAGTHRWTESTDAMELWREYQRSGEARVRDRLVMTYAPLLKFIVYRKIASLPAVREADDLVSAGLEALIKSLDRYDPEKGATLEQYLWTRIYGAVIDELRRGDWAPRSLRRWERDMLSVQNEFRAIHGRAPTEPELADGLSMTVDQLGARKRDLIASDVGSLSSLVLHSDDGSAEQIDVLPSCDESTDPEQQATRSLARERLLRAFAQLERRQREVAVLLYVKHLTLRETGEVLGGSESRICQIHGRLKRALKLALADDAELMRAAA